MGRSLPVNKAMNQIKRQIPDECNNPGIYEQVLVTSLLLFMKSLQLLAELTEKAVVNPEILQTASAKKSLVNLHKTIETCGSNLEHLPLPPSGGEEADRRIRELGGEIIIFAGTFEPFAFTAGRKERKRITVEFNNSRLMIEQSLHSAIGYFEDLYPGRLTEVLHSLTIASSGS